MTGPTNKATPNEKLVDTCDAVMRAAVVTGFAAAAMLFLLRGVLPALEYPMNSAFALSLLTCMVALVVRAFAANTVPEEVTE